MHRRFTWPCLSNACKYMSTREEKLKDLHIGVAEHVKEMKSVRLLPCQWPRWAPPARFPAFCSYLAAAAAKCRFPRRGPWKSKNCAVSWVRTDIRRKNNNNEKGICTLQARAQTDVLKHGLLCHNFLTKRMGRGRGRGGIKQRGIRHLSDRKLAKYAQNLRGKHLLWVKRRRQELQVNW